PTDSLLGPVERQDERRHAILHVVHSNDCRPRRKRGATFGIWMAMETPKKTAVSREAVPADGTVAAR
ncbi:MAG TPA: hypothetical protein VH397_19960, partial [Xanthobacteraceae bacterium]